MHVCKCSLGGAGTELQSRAKNTVNRQTSWPEQMAKASGQDVWASRWVSSLKTRCVAADVGGGGETKRQERAAANHLAPFTAGGAVGAAARLVRIGAVARVGLNLRRKNERARPIEGGLATARKRVEALCANVRALVHAHWSPLYDKVMRVRSRA
eukprot:753268-Pleurochrysis_carterae.AAC.1